MALVTSPGAQAQSLETESDRAPSQCLAMAQSLPGAVYARFDPPVAAARPLKAAAQAGVVRITYVTHSTYLIETPEGVRIATDYAGWAGEGPAPDVVTMNKAHSSHNTSHPDPAIKHVLRGWNPEGGPARHALTVGDAYIRNVTTDIRSGAGMEKDGNSIFIFETANLCIGHLGHLHHLLTPQHFAAIGRLDIVMVPVDGGLTMSQERMSEVMKRLQASIVLPMHRFAMPMDGFIALMGENFTADYRDGNTLEISLSTLPRRPTVVVLEGT
ncbi:Zn-dependent hydrolase [Phyllobacterium salinisoli]|uniref:Zn-dependent hydrolase n=2 Tax=Phyllobacterium salinisoli TaxID=1899321 RepID=A0A368K3S0_9HYPH|nr:MBL fold metallo-hydrolase [Phyllobacterium salinisoli]RCS24038.1 Zn-dependent hydrolase [Phyllobacterium salinisoli]